MNELQLPEVLATLVRRVLASRDATLLEPAVRSFVDTAPAGEAVESLRLLMTDIDHAGYREAFHTVSLSLTHERSRLPRGRVEELYRAAYGAGYAPVRYLLLTAPPKSVAKPNEVIPDHDLLDIPLGRRKAMARLQDRDMLVRLCADPHPHIVEILLDNPFVIERDIVAMAARRPTLTSVIERVARHLKWSLRYEVQRAITLNPYSPAWVSVSLLAFLRRSHLLETAADARLHGAVREAARMIEGWRYERTGRASEVVPDPIDRH